MAKMMDGNEDERLMMAFNAYDRDQSGSLDKDEVKDMIMHTQKLTAEAAHYMVQGVFVAAKCEVLDFEKFKEAVKAHRLPLGDVWEKGLSKLNDSFRDETQKVRVFSFFFFCIPVFEDETI